MNTGVGSRRSGLMRAIGNAFDLWLLLDSDDDKVRKTALSCLVVLAKVSSELRARQLELDGKEWGVRNDLKTDAEKAAARLLGVDKLPRHPGAKDRRPRESPGPEVNKLLGYVRRNARFPPAQLGHEGDEQAGPAAARDDE